MAEEVVKKKKKRKKKNYFLRLLIAIIVIIGAIVFFNCSLFDVATFEISGNIHYTDSQIKEISQLKTGKNLIFETRLKSGRDKLLDTAYIKIATVKRKLPNIIVIEIEEREEYACVPFGEEYVIIDEEGLVLRSTNEMPKLPILEGLTVQSRTDGQPLEVEQGSLLNQGLKLLKAATAIDFYFERLLLDAVSSKAYIYYNNYYCQGTLQNLLENINKIRATVTQQYQENIQRGCIIVGSNGYISYTPQID